MIDRYSKSASLRQAILDHINAQRSSVSVVAITAALSSVIECVNRQMVSNATKMMVLLGEIERHGTNKQTTYTALVKKTVDAQTMNDRANDKRSKTLTPKKPVRRTGVYIHTPGHFAPETGHVNGKPLKNQDGQCSAIRRVVIGSAG
jgi:hypothetical protein